MPAGAAGKGYEDGSMYDLSVVPPSANRTAAMKALDNLSNAAMTRQASSKHLARAHGKRSYETAAGRRRML